MKITLKQLKQTKARCKPRRKFAPWRCWDQYVKYEFFLFAYLEGISLEPIGLEYFLQSEDLMSTCVTAGKYIDVYGNNESYRTLMDISHKWIALGRPQRKSYLIEVWPKEARKRKPKKGWLVLRENSKFIFRNKDM